MRGGVTPLLRLRSNGHGSSNIKSVDPIPAVLRTGNRHEHCVHISAA
jgi:hypothetical protein